MVANKAQIAVAGNTALARDGEGEAPHYEGIRVIRGKIKMSLAQLEERVAHYPEELREKTRSVQAFFIAQCDSNPEQMRVFAKDTLGFVRSPDYYGNWTKGYYFRGGTSDVGPQGRADWQSFCDKLLEYIRTQASGAKLGVIVTGTVKAIAAKCSEVMDTANPCRIAAVAGPTGSQKTKGLDHVVASLGGFPHAAKLNCTEGMGTLQFKRALGRVYNLKVTDGRRGYIDEMIAAQLQPGRLLVVDNIQRAFRDHQEQQAILEFLLRLQEDRGFPLALSFTRWFLQTLKEGKSADYYEQLVGRCGGLENILVLPDATPKGDLRTIARAYNLHAGETAMEILTRWSKQRGRVRVVFARLWRARQFAQAMGKTELTLELLKQVEDYTPPTEIEDEEGGEK